jgi:hypothetical protein
VKKGWKGSHTANLNALDGSTRYLCVYGLCSILDGFDGALASNGRGAEQAGLAGDLSAEHDSDCESVVVVCRGELV